MTVPLILGALWVIAAAITAMLPMRRQYVPGVSLLICAPPLIGWIGWQHGMIWLFFALFALLSMFRRPLLYFARRALGLSVTVPTDFDPPDPVKDSA
jgi:uncharacterized membrane protein